MKGENIFPGGKKKRGHEANYENPLGTSKGGFNHRGEKEAGNLFLKGLTVKGGPQKINGGGGGGGES